MECWSLVVIYEPPKGNSGNFPAERALAPIFREATLQPTSSPLVSSFSNSTADAYMLPIASHE